MFREKAADEGKEEIANQISSGRSKHFSGTASEGGEDGNSCHTDEDIEKTADSARFHAEHKAGEIESEGGEGKWDGAEWKRYGKGADDAEDGGHQGCFCQCLGGYFCCVHGNLLVK